MYKLYAVVEHFGDLRSGHYGATIKSQDDGTWYTFNDTEVSLVRLTVTPVQVECNPGLNNDANTFVAVPGSKSDLIPQSCTLKYPILPKK